MGKKHMSSATLSKLNIVGILALFCCMSEFTILTPSIAAFAQHFAGTDITTIMFANSITGVVSVPVSVIAGAIMHKTGFKTLGVIGILVMALGGAFPFLLPETTDYMIVIGSRIIVGIGLGIMFPVGSATIIAFFEGQQRSRLLGLGITIQFIFAIVYTTAAGFLTAIGWNYSFLAYLIGIIPLIAVLLWMPEAKYITQARAEAAGNVKATGPKESIPHAIWGFALFALVLWMSMVTVQIITSNVLEWRGLAGPAEAAMVINCCGLGVIVSGLVFPNLIKAFKARLFGIAAALVAIGIVPVLLADNLPVYAIGLFIAGFGASTFFTASQNAAGNISPKSRVPFVSGLMGAMMNLAAFIGPYVFAASMEAMPSMGLNAVFPVLIAIAAVCAVIGLVHPMRSLMVKPSEEE